MKYFTYRLIAAVNGWVDQTENQKKRAEKQFWRAVDNYRLELDTLKPKLSRAAWRFFRVGFAESGLHDGNLLSFTIGDGLSYIPDGGSPFRVNRQRAQARLEFLNYEQVVCYIFELHGLKQAKMNLILEDDPLRQRIGDLYTYELTRGSESYLSLAFLFASGAEIAIEFRKLVFKKTRIDRKYELNDAYS